MSEQNLEDILPANIQKYHERFDRLSATINETKKLAFLWSIMSLGSLQFAIINGCHSIHDEDCDCALSVALSSILALSFANLAKWNTDIFFEKLKKRIEITSKARARMGELLANGSERDRFAAHGVDYRDL